jgi:hypothetical protein
VQLGLSQGGLGLGQGCLGGSHVGFSRSDRLRAGAGFDQIKLSQRAMDLRFGGGHLSVAGPPHQEGQVGLGLGQLRAGGLNVGLSRSPHGQLVVGQRRLIFQRGLLKLGRLRRSANIGSVSHLVVGPLRLFERDFGPA